MANALERPVKYDLEYRAKEDDSWYGVGVVVDGETMTVKYEGYPETFDVKSVAGDFKSEEEIDELVARFRNVSPQLQDNECGSVKEGVIVCAACNAFGKDDILYYDAVVEAIHNVNHSFQNGEEECLCTFVISWLHGPKKGLLNDTGIGGICIVKGTDQVDPRVASFSKLVNRKLKVSFCKSISTSERGSLASKGLFCDGGDKYSSSMRKSISPYEGIRCAENIIDVRCTTEATDHNYSWNWDHDKDLGGQCSNCHLMLVENLERNLLSSSLRDFIYEHTSVRSQAFIFPGTSYVPYTVGIIMVDCGNNLQKIRQFLDNPTHLIVSLKGRPLVISERDLRQTMIKPCRGSLLCRSQDICQVKSTCQELMVVHSGSEAYKRANQARDLFLEFISHQQRLYRKLALEERLFLQTL